MATRKIEQTSMCSQIPPPEKLDLKDGQTTSKNCKKFKRSWQIYETATGLNKKEKTVRLAMFPAIIVEDGLEKYDSFQFGSDEDKNDINEVGNYEIRLKL